MKIGRLASVLSTILVLTFLLWALSGCNSGSFERSKISIITSILPQTYFVERIGGPYVEVETLLGPGQSEHSYDPTPKQIAHLAQAQILFRIGMPIEETLVKKARQAYPNLKIIDTRKGVPLRTMQAADSHDHENHAEDHHDHTDGKDPHIWMNPRLVKLQVQTISNTLAQTDSAHAAEYEKSLNIFLADLDDLDKKITDILAPYKGQTMFVFHPAFGYFADAYGLQQVAIEIEGKEPGARQLAELMDQARRENIKSIFVQAQFSRKSADAIAQGIGAKVISLDPLAPNYLENMESIAHQVAAGLSGK